MHLTQLVAQLPGADQQPVLAESQGDAFVVDPRPPDGYVSPTFAVETWDEGSTVLLVEAPGAVGKSVAAEALGQILNWPLVRAEKAQVGSYSLSGLVQDALGFESDYIQNIARGRAGVVVDSMDEAHFRAGSQNFLAFVDNIHRVSGADSPDKNRQPSVILMSRTDTAELIKLAFADSGTPLAIVKLDFFDHNSANKFVTSVLEKRFAETKRAEYNIHFRAPLPFERLRDQRFRQVMRILLGKQDVELNRDWDESKEFLGYAPVLIALAESLAVMNPVAERTTLETAQSQNESELLNDIVLRILKREQAKLAEQIGDKLRALLPASSESGIDVAALYSPLEQVVRVASLVQGNPFVVALPEGLPHEVRDSYEQSTNQFIADHPFIKGRTFASVVFSDYVKAVMCLDVSASACLTRSPVEEVGEVGPFFLNFVRRFGDEMDACVVSEAIVEPLMHSWSQGQELNGAESGATLLSLFAAGAFLIFTDHSRGTRIGGEGRFEVSDLSGAFHLRRTIRDLAILTDQGVILGSRSEILTLGPHVIVLADEIVVMAEALNVNESSDGGEVILASRSLEANYLSRVSGATASLGLFVDEPPARLHAFKRELKHGRGLVPYDDYVDLRAILTSFRTTVHSGLSVSADRFHRYVMRAGDNRDRMLDALMSKGIIRRDGEYYLLDSGALGKLGFGLLEVKSGTPNEEVLSFLAKTRFGEKE